MNKRQDMTEKVNQTNDSSKILASNVRRIRLSLGLKQIEVIARLQLKGIEVTTSAFSKLEKGTMNPSVSLLIGLTEVLGCDFNELFKH